MIVPTLLNKQMSGSIPGTLPVFHFIVKQSYEVCPILYLFMDGTTRHIECK